ncbi:MAG: hypothetical protein K2Z81_23790 [Cyanobacteria bacterium]|nr:hypothetical protein [Cyanobacteriota bacterium]
MLSTLACLPVVSVPAIAGNSNNEDYDFSKDPYPSSQWLIGLTVLAPTRNLKYKGCKLTKVSEVTVNFKLRKRNRVWDDYQPYEKLWFSNGTAIGCRRLHTLDIPVDSNGSFVIIPTKDVDGHLSALAHAIVRLYVDVHLRPATTMHITCPRESCERFAVELGALNFNQIDQLELYKTGALLNVTSEPPGYDKHFFFRSN